MSNLEQQRKRAKDLVHAARAGDAAALARLRAVRADIGSPARPLKLSDAQLAIAREAGFESWPKLAAHLEAQDVEAFREAVRDGDVERTRQLVARDHVRAHVNDPMFDFGQRAAHLAANNPALLTLLIDAGADVNLKSDWANGPFTVLDHANDETARLLLSHGAVLTPHAAARLGWFDELQAMIERDPALVHARGGDGQQPLHQAMTPAIAEYLLDRGAAIDEPCIDHHSTPAQYALVDRPDVCRTLLARGARPDLFMAARLGDIILANRLIDADPQAVSARINEPGYAPVPPFNIYCWTLGFGMSPHEVARRFGHTHLSEVLQARSPLRVALLNAILAGDEPAVRAMLDEHPSILPSLTPFEHGHLARAIFVEKFDAAELMLRVGFDPAAPGVDRGSALHAACWVGSVRMVEALLARGGVDIDAPDPTHQSPPLGWAAFGSVQRRARGADYQAVIDRLVAAGADIRAQGNRRGMSLLTMAEGNAAVQATLRRHGAA